MKKRRYVSLDINIMLGVVVQLEVSEEDNKKVPDVVIYANGMPLVLKRTDYEILSF